MSQSDGDKMKWDEKERGNILIYFYIVDVVTDCPHKALVARCLSASKKHMLGLEFAA